MKTYLRKYLCKYLCKYLSIYLCMYVCKYVCMCTRPPARPGRPRVGGLRCFSLVFLFAQPSFSFPGCFMAAAAAAADEGQPQHGLWSEWRSSLHVLWSKEKESHVERKTKRPIFCFLLFLFFFFLMKE